VVSRAAGDAPGWLLAAAVRLLPSARRDWGRAMRAELAGIGPARDRWRFTAGCARVVAGQPAAQRAIGYPLLMAGVVVAVVAWSGRVAYAPLRWGLVGLVAILVAVSWLGRRAGVLGPVGGGWAARLVRAGGYLLVGLLALGSVTFMAAAANPDDKAANGVPIFAVVLTSYLLGFLAVTARRSGATARVLAVGAGAGLAAGVVWLVAVLAGPPVPTDVAPACTLVVAAMGAAALGSPGRRGLLAALCAGTLATLLIVTLVGVLARYGPPSLIPDLAPAALSPAADLAQSRIEIEDHYLALLALGCLLATLLGVTTVVTRQRRAAVAGN
jgi:hypothetical protein